MNLWSMVHRARRAARRLVHRHALDREMREEMQAHLEQSAQRYAARGLSPRDAREAARREFGNVAVLQEEGRDVRGARWIESLAADLRFALRQIRRRPLASATIVGVLALGIGVHAGIFAFYQALMLRPTAGVRADPALVRVRGKQRAPVSARWLPRDFSYPEYMELAARRDLFAATTAWTTSLVSLDLGDHEQSTNAQVYFVTDRYFETAGVPITLGRTLPLPSRADGTDGEMAAIISDAMWRALFGGAPDVIGRTITLNDARVRIVGVAPRGFNGFDASGNDRTIWMPLAARATVMHTARRALIDRDSTLLTMAALLAPGMTIERASGEAQLLSEQAVRRMTPAEDHRIRTSDVVALRNNTQLPEDPELVFVTIALGVVAVLVLVVACTNVSALVVGAGMMRSQEIAIRLSLGASRARIVRQLLTESCVLAVAGGATGLGFYWLFTFIVERSFVGVEIAPDLATAAFTLVVALATGILFGLSPALHATRSGVAQVLKGGGTAGGASARTKLQSTLVVVQIAVTQPLLIGIAVTLALVSQQDKRGVEQSTASRVIRVRFEAREIPAPARARLRAAMRALETLPGVQQVTNEGTGRDVLDYTVLPDSRAGLIRQEPIQVRPEGAGPGYFTLLGVPVVRGRDLVASDSAASDRAVLISSDVARELWGNADPIGRRFAQIDHGKTLDRRAIVVGVYDASQGSTRGPGRRVFAIDTTPWRDVSYLVRATGPARPLIGTIRDHLRKTIPDMAVVGIETLQDTFASQDREVMQVGMGAGTAGALVLLLASVGLYGVIALSVTQRRREIGIRIALGARPVEVVALLFRQGVKLGVLGLVIGLPLSLVALTMLAHGITRTGENGVMPIGMIVIGSMIALVVIAVAMVATWIPARRAAIVDPMLALRTD